MITGNPERLAEVRARVSSISWFMRCLAEPIARWANREDACTGRFWEGRYKCQPILDESALAACLAYVDLNPIRAGIAETPETSLFTSAYERIQALEHHTGGGNSAEQLSPGNGIDCGSGGGALTASTGDVSRIRASWLSPFELSADQLRENVPHGRTSNTGCLPMRFEDYLQLLDWTGRQIRQDKRGAIPSDLAPILRRLQLSRDGWLDLLQEFSRLFRRAAGTPSSLRRHTDKWGRRRMAGIGNSRALFG
jgi:hypothetical protein